MSVSILGVEAKFTKFPAGETNVQITDDIKGMSKFVINMQFEGNDDIINLALLVDALRREVYAPIIHLYMPYIPYARQDRVCNNGESLSIKVITSIINSLNLDQVVVADAHSDVSTALINNVVEIPLHQCVYRTEGMSEILEKSPILVAPDAGAMKKVGKAAKYFNLSMITATKVRDTQTGWITNTKVDIDTHQGNKDFLILDDIIEGGMTFLLLEKELRKYTDGNIYLYATHGIFSKGKETLDKAFNGVYSYNTFNK